jgi:hypothetical protein
MDLLQQGRSGNTIMALLLQLWRVQVVALPQNLDHGHSILSETPYSCNAPKSRPLLLRDVG